VQPFEQRTALASGHEVIKQDGIILVTVEAMDGADPASGDVGPTAEIPKQIRDVGACAGILVYD